MKMMMYTLTLTSIVTLMMTMVMITKQKTIMLEWKIMEMESNSMTTSIILDWKSLFFLSCVTLISSAIVKYSNYYMESSVKTKFSKIILTFVASMMMLIVSPNLISAIMGWEGLGMSSFMLIIFYMNKKSLMSGIFTMIVNRVGDITLMMAMMGMMDFNSWMFTSTMIYKSSMIMKMMCISFFSKSAQIPFSAWLTEAMAAPTPVSALVHSSTLVTAGVYLMIRMEMSIKFSTTNKMILILATVTILMASLNAVLEWDIKKLVALSTLSQLSTMFISISMNMYKMATFHMFMHAMFKALIFVCSSTLISLTNSQNIRKIKMSCQTSIITMTSMIIANLALTGTMFTSGFYSKELIIEMMSSSNINATCMLSFIICMCITSFYSIKLITFTCATNSKQPMKMTKETNDQSTSKMMLVTPSVMMGNKMNWLINMNTQIPYMSKMEKMSPVIVFMMMLMCLDQMYKYQNNKKMNKSKIMINYMWFMKTLNIPAKMLSLKMMYLINKISETGKIYKMTKNMTNSVIKKAATAFTATVPTPQTTMQIIVIMMMIIL